MGIISPKGFAEGDLSSFHDLNDVDKQWNKVGTDINGLNVREEGLDRRVIQTSAWIPNARQSTSNFRSSGNTGELNFPIDPHINFPAMSGSAGGVGGGQPIIKATWNRSNTQAIMVRCSFRMTWNCSKIMTHPDTGTRNCAESPFTAYLVRYNDSTDLHASGEEVKNIATWELTKAFGSSTATSRGGNVEYDYDRRSNMSGSITLCDLVTPDEIWARNATDTGPSDITFKWKMMYKHPNRGGSLPGPDCETGVKIHDMNFYAIPFNK